MSRISIDVTPEQHQQLKALAALQGKSIKEFVLARTLGVRGDAQANLSALESLLDERIREAQDQGPSNQTVGAIFKEALNETGNEPNG